MRAGCNGVMGKVVGQSRPCAGRDCKLNSARGMLCGVSPGRAANLVWRPQSTLLLCSTVSLWTVLPVRATCMVVYSCPVGHVCMCCVCDDLPAACNDHASECCNSPGCMHAPWRRAVAGGRVGSKDVQLHQPPATGCAALMSTADCLVWWLLRLQLQLLVGTCNCHVCCMCSSGCSAVGMFVQTVHALT